MLDRFVFHFRSSCASEGLCGLSGRSQKCSRGDSVGDPMEESTKLSAMINEAEAVRVSDWLQEAVQSGARLVTGGDREKAIVQPTVIADVKPGMKLATQELFGPAIGVAPVKDFDEAMEIANGVNYGLGASIFTRCQHSLTLRSTD